MKKEKPLFIKSQNKKMRESGCCFRSCGGMPVMLRNSSLVGTRLKKLIDKIKK